MIRAALAFGLLRLALSPFRQLRHKDENMSSVARWMGVPRSTLAYALKKTEREIEREPETRGRPAALTNAQVHCAALRGWEDSWLVLARRDVTGCASPCIAHAACGGVADQASSSDLVLEGDRLQHEGLEGAPRPNVLPQHDRAGLEEAR